MPPVPRLRLTAACLTLLAVLTACTGPAGSGGSSGTGVDASALNTALDAVAQARAEVAGRLDAELRAGVRVEPLAAGLRSPSDIDATLEEVPGVVGLMDAADPAAGAAAVDELDRALAAARQAVASTAATVESGSWQEQFLEAQDDVLDALATWSAASRAVQDVVAGNWELWQRVVDAAAVLAEDRWRYRSEEEAAGTWEIEVGDDLEPLATAARALTAAATGRDDAATAVAAADERAAAVFAARPGAQSTAAP